MVRKCSFLVAVATAAFFCGYSALWADPGRCGKDDGAPELTLAVDLATVPGGIGFHASGEPDALAYLSLKVDSASGTQILLQPIIFDASGDWSIQGPLAALEGLGSFSCEMQVFFVDDEFNIHASNSLTFRSQVYPYGSAPIPAPSSGVFEAPLPGTVSPLFEIQWQSYLGTSSSLLPSTFIFLVGPTGVEGEIPVN